MACLVCEAEDEGAQCSPNSGGNKNLNASEDMLDFGMMSDYSRRSAAGSARTKATRCHKRKCRCRSRSNILGQIRPKTLYLAPFLCF